jgi:hypothetical protein
MEREDGSMNEPDKEGLEEYAKSLDLTPVEVLALLDNALAREPEE